MQRTKTKLIKDYRLERKSIGSEDESILPWIDYSVSTPELSLDHSFAEIEEMEISFDQELTSLTLELRNSNGSAKVSLTLSCAEKLVEFLRELGHPL